MTRRLLLLLPLLAGLTAACNMVVSEMPMFAEADRGGPAPRDGVWISDDEECSFDPAGPETSWPDCAIWAVSRRWGREFEFRNGKGETQRITAIFAAGKPEILQAEWIDDAKEPKRPYYFFYAVEPADASSKGGFTRALVWPVQCGLQATPTSDIQPFAGISAECRPSSADAIRSAADLSRGSDERKVWRWLRPERP